jgi:hypothetical protein
MYSQKRMEYAVQLIKKGHAVEEALVANILYESKAMRHGLDSVIDRVSKSDSKSGTTEIEVVRLAKAVGQEAADG